MAGDGPAAAERGGDRGWQACAKTLAGAGCKDAGASQGVIAGDVCETRCGADVYREWRQGPSGPARGVEEGPGCGRGSGWAVHRGGGWAWELSQAGGG